MALSVPSVNVGCSYTYCLGRPPDRMAGQKGPSLSRKGRIICRCVSFCSLFYEFQTGFLTEEPLFFFIGVTNCREVSTVDDRGTVFGLFP